MHCHKHAIFEEHFGVLETERLKGEGWIASFCKAYNLQEHRRHGEAGSVDITAVKAERERVRELLSRFALKDIFNFDEMSVFAFYVL